MSEVYESIIEQGLKRLAEVRERAVDEASRVCSDARDQLSIIQEVAERDVFKDAVLLAVGEAHVSLAQVGDRPWVQGFNSGSGCCLTVVQSKLNSPYSQDMKKYRAMLVFFEERPPVGPAARE